MIVINGSYGEGGGQVLRTSLTLSALLGEPVRIENIRAKRRKPGLQAQHLTGVRAIAEICDAELEGAHLGSLALTFRPLSSPRAGEYSFDVAKARKGGSAGATSLVFQTLLLPLAFAPGQSRLTIRGGTHVAWSPAFHYLKYVYLPTLAHTGLEARVEIERWGWYPIGGGEMTALIKGQGFLLPASPFSKREFSRKGVAAQPSWASFGPRRPMRLACYPLDKADVRLSERSQRNQGEEGKERESRESYLPGLDLVGRGELRRLWGISATSNLPPHISQRQKKRAEEYLQRYGFDPQIEIVDAPSPGQGTIVFLVSEYEHTVAGFSSFGKRGKPAEKVAEETCREFIEYHQSGACLDKHLADQLILPMALAFGPSVFSTCEITMHLLTNVWVVEQFLDLRFEIKGEEGQRGNVQKRASESS
ncbi:MAG: RNA 3'-terminal phosphate cyclase [Anaerolineae bacterium]